MNLILGTGPLAMSVMRELVKRGELVKMVNSSGIADVPQGVLLVKADLMDEGQATAVMKDARTIYQCAQPAYHKWGSLSARMQDNIVSGAMASEAKLVVAENLYMYGFVKGSIHEQLPDAPSSKKGEIRAALSQKLIKLHRDGSLQVAIGRGADFFGPCVRNSSVGDRFFKPIVEGKACTVLGNPDKKHTYTFIDDFGKALVLLSNHEDSFGQVWHVPNADTITTRQFAEMAYRIVGKPARVKSMGRGMLRLGGLFIPEARESIEMMYQFENDFIVDSRKFSDRFGVMPTPLEQALSLTIEWYLSRSSS
ncbi:MAG: NAD-dependent epimerase/dehydratase family protein [Candidatus Cohnella colombiensis]|uniref:NAD-dependent epimerase/dehydratase family protein n=1 Tax=Candidatus Cohnella colombiensis TaxID=3121368 RepID=A0AA95EZK5_9BACL|nr:MAG: NAD-dependent epimerase/dehydratase family protein [Cohnella sp.]